MKFFLIYAITLIIFFIIDLLWLGVIAKNLYQRELGFLLAKNVNWSAAIAFYFIYIFGIVFFAIGPHLAKESLLHSLISGGILGFVCYATYDLTNYATIEHWPFKIVIYDLIWGTFLTATTAYVSSWIIRISHLNPYI